MDKTTTDNITACLEKLTEEALTAFKWEVSRIYSLAQHPKFVPESLVRKAIRAAEANARRLLAASVLEVSKISIDPEAYAELDQAINSHLSNLEGEVVEGKGFSLGTAVVGVVDVKLATVWGGVNRSLENYRASFKGEKNNGGRPPEYAWEEAGAHVRTVFPDGLPTGRGSKAKIVKTMGDWFAVNADKIPNNSDLFDHANRLIKKCL